MLSKDQGFSLRISWLLLKPLWNILFMQSFEQVLVHVLVGDL